MAVPPVSGSFVEQSGVTTAQRESAAVEVIQAATVALSSVTVPALDTIADLSATFGVVDGQNVLVLGYTSPDDGGGGRFYWDAASAATADGGLIVMGSTATGRWRRSI